MQLLSSIIFPSIGVAVSYVAPNRLVALLLFRKSSYSRLHNPLLVPCWGLFDHPISCMRTGLEPQQFTTIQARLDLISSGQMEVRSTKLYHI